MSIFAFLFFVFFENSCYPVSFSLWPFFCSKLSALRCTLVVNNLHISFWPPHFVFMNSTYFDIRFLDIFHFVAFLFLTIRVAFILHSNRFLISSFFVFYCFTFAFFCCHLYLFQFCFFHHWRQTRCGYSRRRAQPLSFRFSKNALYIFNSRVDLSSIFVLLLCFSFLQNVRSRWILFTFHFFLVFNEYQLDEIRLSEFSMKRWLVEGSLVCFSYSFSIWLDRRCMKRRTQPIPKEKPNQFYCLREGTKRNSHGIRHLRTGGTLPLKGFSLPPKWTGKS